MYIKVPFYTYIVCFVIQPPPIIPRHQPIEEVDTASASSAEDSVTDSGRGGSEEGEEHGQLESLIPT